MKRPDVSIVIRSWNAVEYLKLTWETAIAGVDPSLNFETIIVDDNSDIATRDYLNTIRPTTLILNNIRRGSGGGTSQAHRVARGRYVAVLDSDVILPRNWLAGLLAELEDGKGTLISPVRFSGLLHPVTREPLRTAWNRIRREHDGASPPQIFAEFSGGRSVEEFGAILTKNADTTTDVICLPNCVGSSCIVYDRVYIDTVGGYLDYDYFPYGAEDIDLCWRIGAAGGRVLRSGTIYVHHFEHSSLNKNRFDYQASLRSNNKLLFQRWRKELFDFIEREKQRGCDLADIRARYWLIDLFWEFLLDEDLHIFD